MIKKRTKIIATLGPATDDPKVLKKLFELGVNLVRLNFSHGTHKDHEKRFNLAHEIAKETEQVVGVLADLQGPKIRVAKFEAGKVALKKGQTFVLDPSFSDENGNEKIVGLDYKDLPNDVSAGDTLLLDDGRLVFKVDEIKNSQIICTVEVEGILSNNKGINRLGGGLSAPAITEKDKKDLIKAIELGADYIAISFPRDGKDIDVARELIKAQNASTHIIAKIERCEAITNLDSIIGASDGLMVARGDLAVEVGEAQVPALQKDIIHKASLVGKPVITATQMMESMIENTVPTRAEVSDVANAVLDGTDAVMLSAETATGKYPEKVVSAMANICKSIEEHPKSHAAGQTLRRESHQIDESIAMATIYTANHFDIKAIISLTEAGITPLYMSRVRTDIPIYAFSRHPETHRKVTLYRNVYPISFDITQIAPKSVEKEALKKLVERSFIQENDLVVLTQGDRIGVHGRTNSMKILKPSDLLK